MAQFPTIVRDRTSTFLLLLTHFSAVIIKALLRGVKDGNDILTLSLGGPGGWTGSMASVVASRIAASGKIVTIAAGNEVCCSWDASALGFNLNIK
jgi:subtilisin family serine protease